MARAVLGDLCAVAFSRPNCPPFGGSTLKRILSISHLILPLLALTSATCLSAQTIAVDKATLTFSGQFGGAAVAQTVNITSSTGASIPYALAVPQGTNWLKVSVPGSGPLTIVSGNTPAAVTVTADPTGLPAGTYGPVTLTVLGGSGTNPNITATLNVSTIGVSPQTLTFTYTLGSNTFPAAQNLTLTSGAGTQATCTTATTTGGNWVGPLQNPCFSPGMLTVQLDPSVLAGLSANTYTGAITITPSAGQGPPAVVGLTLTVLPTPPVTVNPLSLILNYQSGVAAPNPSEVFTISTTASQQLSFNFIQTGSLTSISTINPPNGTTSATGTAQVTYTVNPTGLAVGTYTGKITLLTPGGSPTQQDIEVTLNVSSTPLLNVPNATLNFTGQVGITPPAQTVNITATSGTLSYAVTQSANSSWLSVPNAGNTTTPLTVSVNPAGLTAQTEPYVATVSVTSATPGSSAQQFKVALTITNEPTITASVTELKFPYQIGQSAPVAVRSVALKSLTGVALNYRATVATTTCGSTWLQAANANNSLAGVTDDILKVSIAPAGLAAGTCSGSITINATNQATGAAALGSPIAIAVTLFVSTGAQLVLTPPDPPVFTVVGVGGQSPPAQPIGISSTGTDVLTYIVKFDSNNAVNWLAVTPQGGTTSSNNVLNVIVIPGNLTAGTYTGTITITATGPGGAAVANSPVEIPVTLYVTAGSLTLSNSNLTFAQTLGGPAPVAQTVTVGSSGQPLNYTAVANSNNAVSWLSVSPASGNTANSGTLTVTVDGSKLAAGVTYPGTIKVTSPGAGDSQTINVQFSVAPGTLSAPTATLTFTQAAGGPAPLAQTIAVSGSPAPLNYTATAAMLNGTGWLSVTPASGTTPSSVQVSVNGAALTVGQYIGSVNIASTGATGSPIAVPVVLNVVAPAVLAASPTSLSFAYNIGQSAPAPLSVQVSATGAANVPLSAQVKYDGAAGQTWLAVTPATATTPATFSVSVVPGSLAAGKYTGSVVINSAYTLVATTVPVTLIVAAIPTPVMTSVANAASYATGGVSPGENIVLFGTGVGPADLVQATVVNNVFPTLVGATRVLFDGIAAPVLYASAQQTSVMVPYGVNGRTSTSIVVEYSGVQSAPVSQAVVATVPGLYTLNQAGTGPGAILNHDLSINGLANPEKRGSFIVIYMTGEGQTDPAGADGVVIPPVLSALKRPVLPVTVTIGGIDAPVLYAGSAAGLISGVMQVNVTIPATAPTGTQPVVVTVGTTKSQSGAGAATVVVQ
jgi:uncharacterized protein (TIGR03437 family)